MSLATLASKNARATASAVKGAGTKFLLSDKEIFFGYFLFSKRPEASPLDSTRREAVKASRDGTNARSATEIFFGYFLFSKRK